MRAAAVSLPRRLAAATSFSSRTAITPNLGCYEPCRRLRRGPSRAAAAGATFFAAPLESPPTVRYAPNLMDLAPKSDTTALRPRVLDAFARHSSYEGDGFLNHCIRLFELTKLVMEAEQIDFDDDVAFGIAMFHDLGLTMPRDESPSYMHRSLRLLQDEFGELCEKVDDTVLSECMLLNHRVFPVPTCSSAAEAFRKAVWIEHTRGIKRYGLLDKAAVQDVFERYPRANLDKVLLDFFWITVRNEPRTITNGILF